MAESKREDDGERRKQIDTDLIPPTGCFSLEISFDEDDAGLFITPNHLNSTPESENGGDIFDLLEAVSPNDLDTTGYQTRHGISDTTFNTSTPKLKPCATGNISVGNVDDTIGDNTLREFSENVSLSSDEEELVSLASRVPNKSTVARLKGRRSVANPKNGAELTTEQDRNVNSKSPPPPKENSAEPVGSKDRFVRATEKDIDDLQYESKAKRTHVQTKWGIVLLTDWLKFAGLPKEFEQLESPELGQILKRFFVEVRQKDGKKYSRSSLLSLRACIQRYLVGPPFNRQINLLTDGDFQGLNAILSGMIKRQKKLGEDVTKKHDAITDEDLEKMYSSGVLSNDNPTSLQFKIFFEVTLHFGRRGREGLKELRKTDIVFKTDPKGVEFATLAFNPSEKNHPGTSHHIAEHDQKMFSTGGEDCPVNSLKFYLSKLHPDNHALFQRPKVSGYHTSTIWYCDREVGVNAIGNFMVAISDRAKLSARYTNHCIRATTVTRLRDGGVDPQDIVAVTGHRCVNSISAYSSTNVEKRKEMSHALSKAIGKNVAKKKGIAPPKTPVQAVKPTPRKVAFSPYISSPRRSPRLAEMASKQKKKQPSSAKKLDFAGAIPDDDMVQQVSSHGLNQVDQRQPTIINVNGGVVNIYFK